MSTAAWRTSISPLKKSLSTCASHGGEPIHVSTAAALLRKGELDESDLLCGAHIPYDEKGSERTETERRTSVRTAEQLLGQTCGHAAGLPSHGCPVQTTSILPIRSRLNPEDAVRFRRSWARNKIPYAVDGCGVPSFSLPLYRAALAYARLMDTAVNSGGSTPLSRYAESARLIAGAMTTHPEYVAGAWSITTPLMEAMNGQLLAKEGAEGFYSMGMFPELARELQQVTDVAEGTSVGIAIKVADGSMDRGRNPAILRTLELLGLNPAESPLLARYYDSSLRNAAGRIVGDVKAEFELKFL